VQITRALRILVDDHMDELIDNEDKEEPRSSEETDALEVSLSHSSVLDTSFLNIQISFFDNRKQD
jgi:hypothetical protein